jgi:hypothetical protein
MTDQPNPLSDDELDLAASLAIDSQSLDERPLSADDRARIEARATALQAAVDAVAEPVPPPPAETRVAQLAAAVAAAPGGATTPADAAPATVGRPVPMRRAARRRARAVAPWAAAAAIAVVVVIAVAALAGHHQHDESTSTASAVGGTTAPTSTTVPSSLSPVGSAIPSGAPQDLGTVADAAALVGRVRAASSSFLNKSAEQATAGGLTTTTPAMANYDAACASALGALEPPVASVVFQAQAVLGTTPVRVLVYEPVGATDGARRLVAISSASCRVLVDRSL